MRRDYPIIQYADDTIVVLPANKDDLKVMKDILNLYAAFTGLRINFHKSLMMPINVPQQEMEELAALFECNLGTMPFTYLGLPMGTTRPTIRDMSPLTDRVERRLTATASFLSYGDRLVLVNSVMSSLPTFYLLCLHLPVGMLEVIDRGRRHCLWRKKDKDKVNSLAAWEMVCRPKNKGGLGIIDLKVQNKALLVKHLHKFYNDDTTPWVQLVKDTYYYNTVPHAVVTSGSFWWRAVFALSDAYRAITRCAVGNGVTVLFWSDNWLQGKLDERYPRLFSFAIDKLQSVAEFMGNVNQLQCFHLPLSVQVHHEYAQLQVLLQGVHLDNNVKDTWICTLGNGVFKPSKIYRYHFQHLPTDASSCWIWKSKCQSKHKFFAWLVLHDRINTQEMLIRRHWHVSSSSDCVLCASHQMEDWRHLFFNCMFSTRVWNYLQISWNPTSTPAQALLQAKGGDLSLLGDLEAEERMDIQKHSTNV